MAKKSRPGGKGFGGTDCTNPKVGGGGNTDGGKYKEPNYGPHPTAKDPGVSGARSDSAIGGRK